VEQDKEGACFHELRGGPLVGLCHVLGTGSPLHDLVRDEAATSKDVTYGLGVFRTDGSMVFQMQVLPGYENSMVWEFDAPGSYDIRSTEYSGPEHPHMFVEDAIRVVP
jgi:hypothetical protein